MQTVNSSFNIQANNIDYTSAQLFTEAGPMGLSLVVLDSANCFSAVVCYSFPAGTQESELPEKFKEIFESEKLLQQQYSKTHLFWSFPESILVPAELMNTDRNLKMLNLVFGDAKAGVIRSDFLYKHNLHNVYRTAQTVIDVFSSFLPVATQTHMFSTMINMEIPEGNNLYAVFYNSCLSIMLCKEGKLQVVQNFDYQDANDCVFHLLNVCKGFEVPPESITLHINGMIDEKSALYAAVYKYFLNIEFDQLPEDYSYGDEVKEHPPHFFSHLFALAACV